MTDKVLFNKHNPTPEELQMRINRAVEIYNYTRSTMSDDEVAKLRAYLSCDIYKYVAEVYKPSLDDLARCELELEKADGGQYLMLFDEYRGKGLSASAAETAARKALKIDPIYVEAYKNHSDAKTIAEITSQIMRMVTQVLHSMSYKSN